MRPVEELAKLSPDDMSDEEIQAFLDHLESFKVPTSPTPKAPRARKEAKEKKPSWRDALFNK